MPENEKKDRPEEKRTEEKKISTKAERAEWRKKHKRKRIIINAVAIFLAAAAVFGLVAGLSSSCEKREEPPETTAAAVIVDTSEGGVIRVDSANRISFKVPEDGSFVGFRLKKLPEEKDAFFSWLLEDDIRKYYPEASDSFPGVYTEVQNGQPETGLLDYDIRIYNAARLRNVFTLDGSAVVEKKDSVIGCEALWITSKGGARTVTVEETEQSWLAPDINMLLLYSAKYNCVLVLTGAASLTDFDKLEQLAENTELAGTDYPALSAESGNEFWGAVG